MAKYIDKSALVAEIESKIKEWRLGSSSEAKFRIEVYKELSEWLDTLEAKEIGVDLGDPKFDIGVKTVWDSSNCLEISRYGNSRNGDDLEEAAIKYGNCFEKHSDLASILGIKKADFHKPASNSD